MINPIPHPLKNRELYNKISDEAHERLETAIKSNDMQGVTLAQTMSKSARQFRDIEIQCIPERKEIEEEIRKIRNSVQKRNYNKSKK